MRHWQASGAHSERLVRASGRLAAQVQRHAQRGFAPAIVTDRPPGFLESEGPVEVLADYVGGTQLQLDDRDAGGQRR